MTVAPILISLLLSIGVRIVRYGITVFFEARKLRRPDIRDKEGTRQYLVNIAGWAAYLHNMFLQNLHTVGFAIAVFLEICKPGPQWDAFYDALCYDFGVSGEFPPQKYAPAPVPEKEKRRRRIDRLCRNLRARSIIRDIGGNDVTESERNTAEEYLSYARYLLDHPAVQHQTQAMYAAVRTA
jgi:hypothetical protein